MNKTKTNVWGWTEIQRQLTCNALHCSPLSAFVDLSPFFAGKVWFVFGGDRAIQTKLVVKALLVTIDHSGSQKSRCKRGSQNRVRPPSKCNRWLNETQHAGHAISWRHAERSQREKHAITQKKKKRGRFHLSHSLRGPPAFLKSRDAAGMKRSTKVAMRTRVP